MPTLIDRAATCGWGALAVVSCVLLCEAPFARAVNPADAGAPSSSLPGLNDSPSADAKTTADFEALFGAEERQLKGPHSPQDDAKFASEMVDKATSVADEPALVSLMYEKAYQYGIKGPDGYAAAVTAAQRLFDAAGSAEKQTCRKRLLDLYQIIAHRSAGAQRKEAGEAYIKAALEDANEAEQTHKSAMAMKRLRDASAMASLVGSPQANSVNDAVRALQTREQIQERADRLAAQLRRNPEDSAVRAQLVAIYLLSLDEPANAVLIAKGQADPTLCNMVELAGRPDKDLTGEEYLTLAQWYRKLAGVEGVPTTAKGTALCRADGLYSQFLRAHEAHDAQRLEAERQKAETERAIDALGLGVVADRIVIWNTHNGPGNDRGAAVINVALLLKGQPVWERAGVPMPWTAGKSESLTLDLPKVHFDKVRVEVVKWQNHGGGLAEIQVFSGGRNIALGAPVSASGAFDAHNTAANLVDGITESAEYGKGFWLLPDRTSGWAEVAVRPGVHKE